MDESWSLTRFGLGTPQVRGEREGYCCCEPQRRVVPAIPAREARASHGIIHWLGGPQKVSGRMYRLQVIALATPTRADRHQSEKDTRHNAELAARDFDLSRNHLSPGPGLLQVPGVARCSCEAWGGPCLKIKK